MMTFATIVAWVIVVAALAFLAFAILYLCIFGIDQGDR